MSHAPALNQLPQVREAVSAISANLRVRESDAHQADAVADALHERVEVILSARGRVAELDHAFYLHLSEALKVLVPATAVGLGAAVFAGTLQALGRIEVDPISAVAGVVAYALCARALMPDRLDRARVLWEARGRLDTLATELRHREVDPTGLVSALYVAVPGLADARDPDSRDRPPRTPGTGRRSSVPREIMALPEGTR